MTLLDPESHPISLVHAWSDALGPDWSATFSRYLYVPQTVRDDRTEFSVPLRKVTISWLQEQLGGLPQGYELAFHSRLQRRSQAFHVPMIDFAENPASGKALNRWVKNHLALDLTLFRSGRSFHGYGTRPISQEEWVRFMGLLLLANLPKRRPLVDNRWIGHRLMAGYSALRWSHNSPHYLSSPTKLKT